MKKILCFLAMLSIAGLSAQPQQKIAVLDIKAKAGIDPMTVSSLTDYTCTVIADMGTYDVIGKDDMQAMLEHIADKQLLECDDTKCLAQIGGALGVELLMAGNIGMVGKMYLINFKLINIEEAQVQNRVSVQYVGDETGLVAKVKESVDQLFGLAAPEAVPAAEKTAPAKVETPPAAPVAAVQPEAAAQPEAPAPPVARTATESGRRWRLVVQPGVHYNFYTEGVGYTQHLGIQTNRIYTGLQLIVNNHDYDDSEADPMGLQDWMDADCHGVAAVCLFRLNRHQLVGMHVGGVAGFYDAYNTYYFYDPRSGMPPDQEDRNLRAFGGFKLRLDAGGKRVRIAVESLGMFGPEDAYSPALGIWESGSGILGQIDLGLMLLF